MGLNKPLFFMYVIEMFMEIWYNKLLKQKWGEEMNKNELTILVKEAKERFLDVFPQSAEILAKTDIVLLSNRNRAEMRKKVFEDHGASFREDGDNEGEALLGYKGFAVIIYTAAIKSENRFRWVLWHELGHVFSFVTCKELFIDAENDKNAWRDTLIRSGMSVWSEFIAEVIAYNVADEPPQPIAWPKQEEMRGLMNAAVNGPVLSTYDLAFYCAIYMEDPTIYAMLQRNKEASIGLDDCDDEIIPLIENLLYILDQQLCKDEHWIIERKMLEAIGQCVDDLFAYKSLVNVSKTLRQRIIEADD